MTTPILNTFAFLLTNPDGSDMSLMELFHAGKEIMWPILLLSFLGTTVVVERILFIIRENSTREPEVVEKMMECVERRDLQAAVEIGKKSKDFIARILVYALTNKEFSMTNAFIRASGHELTRFGQGMATLDTCITAAPMLGLLGTVTGMMRTFGALGGGDIGAAASTITGGVAEALIATMCGLFIAICCLLPYNYLNARIEEAKHDVADASNALEILVKKSETIPPFAPLRPALARTVQSLNPTNPMAGSSGGGGSGGKKKARIEIIPLIDVIFFLLATFVLFTLSLNKTAGVKVELPKSTSAEVRDPSSSKTISVTSEGAVAWNDQIIPLDDLINNIIAWSQATNHEGKILINADAEAKFSQVFGYVLAEVRKANFKKVLIETTVAPKSSS